jgi:transposase
MKTTPPDDPPVQSVSVPPESGVRCSSSSVANARMRSASVGGLLELTMALSAFSAMVFSVDEKSQIQALQRAQPILPMDFGQPERRTHNYVRHGTLDLFAALNVATGEVIARCKPQHRAQDFVAFLREIESTVEPTVDIHVVLDNLGAHRAPPVQRWLLRHPRVHFHFTPTYASWLNLVERFFGLLTEKALKRGSHTSIAQLRAAILAYG